MPVSLSTIAAKDSAGAAIVGGLQAQDKSGVGDGPFTLGHVVIDGKAGINMLGIFAEDAAHTSGDTGVMALTVRRDTALALAGTVNDYQPAITDADGKLWIRTTELETALADAAAASNPLVTDVIINGSTPLTPKFAPIAASASGNNTLVAAVTSKKIRVLAYNFIANGTVNVKVQTGAGGTDLTGLKYCVANMGLVAPFNPLGWFETAAGVLLNLNLSAAIAVGGELVYIEV